MSTLSPDQWSALSPYLDYFKPAHYQQTDTTERGRVIFNRIGRRSYHIANMRINHDRRVADVETNYDTANGVFNNLFSTAHPLFYTQDDGSAFPPLKLPQGNSFIVKDLFTDFKRHDLGTNFYERNWDGTHAANAFPDAPIVGCRQHWALWPRWSQHDIERCHSSPWGRGSCFAQLVCGSVWE